MSVEVSYILIECLRLCIFLLSVSEALCILGVWVLYVLK